MPPVWRRLFGRGTDSSGESEDALTRESDAWLRRLLAEAKGIGHEWEIDERRVRALPSAEALLAEDAETLREGALAASAALVAARHHKSMGGGSWKRRALRGLLVAIFRRKHDWTEAQLGALVKDARQMVKVASWWGGYPIGGLVQQLSRHTKAHGLSPDLERIVRGYYERLRLETNHEDQRKGTQRLAVLLSGEPEEIVALVDAEAWAANILRDIEGLEAEARTAWRQLLRHAASGSSSKPSKRFLSQAGKLIDVVGPGSFRERITTWLDSLASGSTEPVVDPNAQTLRGLVWSCLALEPFDVARPVGDLAERMARKITGHGPRSVKVANGCIHVLSTAATELSLAQLTRMRQKVRHASLRARIEGALESAARAAGITIAELEEMVVPTFDVRADGSLGDEVAGFVPVLQQRGATSVALAWRKEDGKLQKSVPAPVKRDASQALAEIKGRVKAIKSLLPGQSDRIERFFSAPPRTWRLDTWRQRYVDHPIVGRVARPLIWAFRVPGGWRPGMWRAGEMVDARGRALEGLGDATEVGLWHPMDAQLETVRAWRDHLREHEIVQPFKQAYREIYLLTDAERNTATYSNRFAAHIIKQHQLAALARQRGWAYTLQGAFDSQDAPTLELPEWDLRVEFWVNPVEEPLADSGIFLYVATDQVRFYDRAGTRVPLDRVPPRAFTEVMRDVDLFVGVCSIGNDPEWADQGGAEALYGYWREYAFGDLSQTAHTRREVLAELVPMLAIRDRCTLEDRFLEVRGDLRTYRIHLGSGNIMMEPNGQYLCIVVDRGKQRGGRLFVPFEGDSMLSVIISKALLLAADRKITDPTILSQIRV